MAEALAAEYQILNLSRAYVLSRALHVCAQLNIADALESGPQTSKIIAKKTNTNPETIHRLMNFLSSNKIFEQVSEDLFTLSELSQPLLSNSANSVKDVLLMVDEHWWQSVGYWSKSFTSEKSAFEHANDTPFFEFLSTHPHKQAQFDKGMARLSTFDNKAIINAYDFSPYNSMIDIGCGLAGLAKTLKETYPTAKIAALDSPQVLKNISPHDENIQLISGNFFESLPTECDLYIYKGVLHDFSDNNVIQILTLCREMSPPHSKTLIAEQILPIEEGPHPNKTMDMVMMFLLNGRQRTLKEWSTLCEKSGFSISNIIKTKSIFSLIELTH